MIPAHKNCRSPWPWAWMSTTLVVPGGVKMVLAFFFARPGAHSILSLPFFGIFVFKILVGIPKSLNLWGERAETLVTSNHWCWPSTLGGTSWGTEGSAVKNLPADAGDGGSILGREAPLKKEMENYSSILVWTIPWAEAPGELQFMGLQRVGHDRALGSRCRVLFANLVSCLHFSPGSVISYVIRKLQIQGSKPGPCLSHFPIM